QLQQLTVQLPQLESGNQTGCWSLIELQGSFESRTLAEDNLIDQEEKLRGGLIGDLLFSRHSGQPLLIVGHHLLQGKSVPLEKPLAVIRGNQIVGVIRNKLVFRDRPKPIIASVTKHLINLSYRLIVKLASALVAYSSGSESEGDAPEAAEAVKNYKSTKQKSSEISGDSDGDFDDAKYDDEHNSDTATAEDEESKSTEEKRSSKLISGSNSFGLIQSASDHSNSPSDEDTDDNQSDGFVEIDVELEDSELDSTDLKQQNSNRQQQQASSSSNLLPSFAAASAEHESVFVTEYHKAERKKLAVLAHHVTPIEAATNSASRSSGLKRIPLCRRFLSGRCDRGHRCPYSHSEEAKERALVVRKPSAENPAADGDNRMARKRGHAGVTDSLAPAKRSLAVLGPQLGLRGNK
uniref:C3H1-type domain-containing protein n=1 Tax=Macrostomum lignano TaxID=282301 RepID=A0A1I8GGQ5_9PLAT